MIRTWATKRLKFCDTLIMGQSPEGASVNSDGDGVLFLQGNADFGDLHPLPTVTTTQPEKLCRAGDVLVSVRAPVGAVNLADREYAIGRGLCAIRPREHQSLFLRYLFTTQADALNSIATGTTFTAVSTQQVGNLQVALPPLAEQRRIAGYLDEATGKVDRLVALRRRQMELLREQRAALIQQAVTRGLNPNAPLKDSGLPWLGQIPKHWEVIRLGRLARLQGGYAFDTADFSEEGVPVVRMSNLKRGDLDLTDSIKVAKEKTFLRFALGEGDVLFGMSGSIGDTGSLGNFAFVRAEHLPAQLNQRVGRFLVRHVKLDARFLRLLVQSKVLGEQILQFVTGTAQFNISAQQVESVVIAVPPIKEQVDAVESIRAQDARFDRLQSAYTRQLELLTEYRAALIHECVTGQRAVPTWEKSA
jgi:type I restriction enzyme S subunit